MQKTIRVQSEPYNMASEVHKLRDNNKAIGGIVTFSGYCRDENGTLSALEIEHYPGMAEKRISEIADEASARWPLLGITVIHRFGKIKTGDEIVLVITSSSHRQAAFEAASFIMDFLKTDAPFWKKEHMLNGESSDWVLAHDEDQLKRDSW